MDILYMMSICFNPAGCAGHKFMDHIWSISDQAGVDETNLAIDFINSLTLDMTIDPEHIQVGLTPKCCDEARGILLKDHDTGKGFRHALAKRRLVGLRTDRSIDYIRRHGTRTNSHTHTHTDRQIHGYSRIEATTTVKKTMKEREKSDIDVDRGTHRETDRHRDRQREK